MVAALLLGTVTSAHADRGFNALPRTRRGDLELARAAYVDKSRAFSTAKRLRALRFIDRAEQRADSMSAEEFLLTILQIPAFADNGHDVLKDNDDDGAWYPQARLPLRMIWFPEGWVVARAAPEVTDLLGAKVTRNRGAFAGRAACAPAPDVGRPGQLPALEP